jgi:hypothetical protein
MASRQSIQIREDKSTMSPLLKRNDELYRMQLVQGVVKPSFDV